MHSLQLIIFYASLQAERRASLYVGSVTEVERGERSCEL